MNIQKGINCYFTVDAFFTIIKEINQSIMTQFKYTCETPNKFVGGDVHSNDLATIENYCIDMGEEHGYSCVRDIDGEIVFDYGDIMDMVEQGIV